MVYEVVCAWVFLLHLCRDRGLQLKVHTRQGSVFKPSHLNKVRDVRCQLHLHQPLPEEGAAVNGASLLTMELPDSFHDVIS